MSLNRIYQGRVSKVEVENPDAAKRKTEPWVPLPDWQNALLRHHALFQDAVNYYIAAIASLGSSPESPLTKLRGRLTEVWATADKNGQSREGMGESLKRAFQFQDVPRLDEAVQLFRQPLKEAGVDDLAMELAGESLLQYANCHLLSQTQEGTASYKVKLAGQRGLSIARIEQLSELRRRWQSLNQALRVEPGKRPPTAAEMRAESIPDPCPDILDRLENIREQRVNQTAHLILAEALGLKLRVPMQDSALRRATGTHGEYAVVRPPVDFIV